MAEQPATNPNRPALYRVAAGSILKGARVEILGTTDQKPLNTLRPTDRVAVHEFLDYRLRDDQQLREATVLLRNMERVWRSKDEEALGREFTVEEAADHERAMRLRVARHMTEHRAESINSKLGQMAERLQRASEEMRRLAESRYALDQKVYQAQHELAWLVPNLGADQLTTDLVGWLQMDAEMKRLGGASEEAES